MRWISIVKYTVYSMIVGSIVLTGCASQNSKDPQLKEISQPKAGESTKESEKAEPVDIDKIIQTAEAYYDKGYTYYKERNWTLAEQEFDNALRTLLDADVDAEMHYKLGKAYNKLFYNINKLTLAQNFFQNLPSEDQTPENKAPEISPSQPSPEPEKNASEQETKATDKTVGEILIDEADPDIRKYVQQISTERSQYREGLERAAQYLPMMRQIFQANNLPTDLVYLPLIESNFKLDAVSPAGAAGLWQFVQATARIYGLKVDKWVDERRDPEKSTAAAAKYLKELYAMLGAWELVLAGYYMGEYRVHNAIGQHRTRDIAALATTKSFGGTAKHYVSRFKAAILMARTAEQYGLDLDAIPPLQYDTVQVKNGERLKDIAKRFGVPYAQLQELNPELKTATTPPRKGKYTLKVPFGMGSVLVAENTLQIENEDSPSAEAKKSGSTSDKYLEYRIKRGETLSKIAEQYGVTVERLMDCNNLSEAKSLHVGQKIKIPTSDGTHASREGLEVIGHVIQKGETLEILAKHYQVEIATLKTYNHIKDVKTLQIGQTVKIPLSRTSVLAKTQERKMLTYRVKRGDSLSKIASTFGVSINQLKEWNNFEGSLLHPGGRIKVWY